MTLANLVLTAGGMDAVTIDGKALFLGGQGSPSTTTDIQSASSNPYAGVENIHPGATHIVQFWHRMPMGGSTCRGVMVGSRP